MLYFQDLGEGWAPAVLNSLEELDFIIGGERDFPIIQSYWIGGSTNATKGSTLQYPDDYSTDGSGNDLYSF